jgi:hypothetical protein
MVKSIDPGPIRYFAVVGLHPAYGLAILGAILVMGLITIRGDGRELDTGLGMILFAQMFLASSGFVGRARQGHFDPMLTHVRSKAAIAAAHWAVSIAPGVLAWVTLAVAGAIAGAPAAISAMAGSRAAALLIVSALAWVVGFALPRGAAGMLWVALLMVLVLQRAELLAAPARAGAIETGVLHAATLIVCPFLLLGKHPPPAPGAFATAVVVPLGLLLWVWRRSRLLDIYLVDRS